MVIHHGGSRSAHLHALDLVKEIGFLMTRPRIRFVRSYMRRMKSIMMDDHRAYLRRVALLRESLPSSTEEREVPTEEVDRIFREVVHVDKKDRMFGQECLSQMYAGGGGSSSELGATSQFNSVVVNQRIEQIQTQLNEQRQRETELEAHLQQQAKAWRKKEKEMEERFQRQAAMQQELQENMKKMIEYMTMSTGFTLPRWSVYCVLTLMFFIEYFLDILDVNYGVCT